MDPATVALSLRRVLLSGILGLALLVPASVIPGPGSAATCAAASTNRVAVVVQHGGGGKTLLRCVSFSGAAIKAGDAVVDSGITWGTVDYGGGLGLAVCQVDGEPATYPPNCFKSSDPFWALFVARGGGAWHTSSQGVSNLDLRDGDAVGLRYEPQAIQLDPPTAAGDCPDPTPPPATPKPTVKPTAPPTARPTEAPGHTSTPMPGSPVATGDASTASVNPSAADGGVAVATGLPGSGATPGPALGSAGAPASAGASPISGASGPAPAGDAPVGLIVVAVAGLALAALGALHLRRAP